MTINIVQKHNQSFARRVGKSLSESQKSSVSHCVDDICHFAGIAPESNLSLNSIDLIKKFVSKLSEKENLVLEIGFGMGEHLFAQIQSNPNMFFLGAEPYLNGVASIKKKCITAGLENYIIWPDDINLLISCLPEKIFDKVYVLFPDPWQKRKQNRKRILNEERIRGLHRILKKDGTLYFATDIENYADQVLAIVKKMAIFHVIDKNISKPHDCYVQTKYHSKSLEEGRVPRFYSMQKS
jgi:tRNA (guanine-N(7)-)-methyltransferase